MYESMTTANLTKSTQSKIDVYRSLSNFDAGKYTEYGKVDVDLSGGCAIDRIPSEV